MFDGTKLTFISNVAFHAVLKVSDYVQEVPQSPTTNQPMTP